MNSLKRLVRTLERRANDLLFSSSESRGAVCFCAMFPDFVDYRQLVDSQVTGLASAYDTYISDVSTVYMAASLEASRFLYALAVVKRPKRILDLGSGFSSYVLCLYAANVDADVCVYSVDDNSDWLDKTRSFLVAYNLKSDNLLTWSDFTSTNAPQFDLIFYDMGIVMQRRAKILPYVLGLLDDDGIIVLDDMHKVYYRFVAMREARKAGLILCSVRKYTLDRFNRFSEVAISPIESQATSGCPDRA